MSRITGVFALAILTVAESVPADDAPAPLPRVIEGVDYHPPDREPTARTVAVSRTMVRIPLQPRSAPRLERLFDVEQAWRDLQGSMTMGRSSDAALPADADPAGRSPWSLSYDDVLASPRVVPGYRTVRTVETTLGYDRNDNGVSSWDEPRDGVWVREEVEYYVGDRLVGSLYRAAQTTYDPDDPDAGGSEVGGSMPLWNWGD